MSNSSPQRPTTPKKDVKATESQDDNHWSNNIYQCVICVGPNGSLNVQITGGSDNGEFPYFANIVHEQITYIEGHVENDDIILEIQGQKVAGFTQKDVIAWLNHCCRSATPITLIASKAGYLDRELRKYLQHRFQKGTPDHDLQNSIRDNLYLRTVPCTTRPPREGEINGTDYTFLTLDQFMALERSGQLLESGIYEGCFYGLPKPDPSSSLSDLPAQLLSVSLNNRELPGHHYGTPQPPKDFPPHQPPITEPRRRNPSGVEALNNQVEGPLTHDMPEQDHWEKAYTDAGEPYYINHTTGTSQWLDPWVQQNGKHNQDSKENLPYGWEKIEDPHYGTYYIDHVNKRTQYESPLPQDADPPVPPRDLKEENWHQNNGLESQDPHSQGGYFPEPLPKTKLPYVFTRNPDQLQGNMLQTVLVKSARGFGFTIVGGDSDDDTEEFLQIKSIVPGGPAWQDGQLHMGDVLAFVNQTCVLGFTHQDVVQLFQSIPPGDAVTLQVCRGYALPFNLNDPNTEVVTTNAVSEDKPLIVQHPRRYHTADKPDYITMEIVKGNTGFGFTISDSGHGQKVKKILDPNHCVQLREGDVLVDINGSDVRQIAHDDIVQLLKDCLIGDTACLTVLRAPMTLPKPKLSKLRASEENVFTLGRKTPDCGSIKGKYEPNSYTPPPNAAQQDYQDMVVTLSKQESGFGFRIVGGTEEGSQVSIGHIVPGGSADLEGSVRSGDEIISIDSHCVVNTSHHFAVQLMGNASHQGHVTLQVRRHFHSGDSGYKSTEGIYPYDIEVHRDENEGFGFVIISSITRAGSTIGRIIEGSPAERCNQLHVGDRILAVNGVSILNLSHGEIVNLIKESGLSARLTIGAPQDDVASNSSQKLTEEGDSLFYLVKLQRGSRGFGFSIRGGREFHKMPLFVLRIAEGGPAHLDGQLRVGDQIMEINGISTSQMTHTDAIETIKQGGSSVQLLVKRGGSIPPALLEPVSGPQNNYYGWTQ